MSKPTGPCTLCGSKRTSSSWRRLPECAGELAGKDGCNACYVALTKAAGKCDEASIQQLMATRCALKGVVGVARRRLVHTRRASSNATAPLPREPPREPPLPRSFTEMLLGVAPAGASGAGPARAPAASPAPRTRRGSAEDSHASRAHSYGSCAPAAQAAAPPSPEPQEQQPVVPPAQAPQLQQGSPGPAASAAPPAAAVQPAARQMLEEWRELAAACTSHVSTHEKQAGQQAWFSARQLAGTGAVLVGFLPALELLLPGTHRSPDPAGVLFVCVCPAPLREMGGDPITCHTLCLVVYCPITGQLMQCRDQVRREENCLYRHPRHDKWAWDSSEGWKLLFPEPSNYGPQLQMFRHALAMFGAITVTAADAQQTFWVDHAQQQPAAAQMPPPRPLHPLVPPPLHPPQQEAVEWPGHQLVPPGPGASAPQMQAGQQLGGSQWPGSPLSVRCPSSMRQQFGSAAYITSPAPQLAVTPVGHAPAASPMWQPAAGQSQLLPLHAAPVHTPQCLPTQQAPAPPPLLPQLAWPSASAPAQLAPLQPAAHFQPQPAQQPLLQPPTGMALPWELPGGAPTSPAAALNGSLFASGPMLPAEHETLPTGWLAQLGLQGPQLPFPPELEFGMLDLTKADDFQLMLDSIWGKQVGEEAAAAAAAESVGASP